MAQKQEVSKTSTWWNGVKAEWHKIIWPTRDDLAKQTAVVVFVSIIMGVVITVADSAALQLVNWLMSL